MRALAATSKKKVVDIFEAIGIIRASFSGRVTIAIQDGGIRFVEVTETIK